MKRLTIARINATIAAEGLNMKLAKGAGYFYFVGEDVTTSEEHGVYGCGPHLNALSLERWIAEAKKRKQ